MGTENKENGELALSHSQPLVKVEPTPAGVENALSLR
jgi:hypothetical protein